MPDAHVSLHSLSTVLILGQHFVEEVLRIDGRSLEPLLVSTDFAEAEQVQIAFVEAFPQDSSKFPLVFCDPQHSLCDADIEAAHMQIYSARCASSGLRSAAAGERSAVGGLRSAAGGERSAAGGLRRTAAGEHSAPLLQHFCYA